jgi:Na+/citrate or Na+/malate symporter
MRELLKNWKNRLSMAFIFLAFFVLVDEYIKESYIFDFHDFYASFPTHEQLFIAFLIVGLILGLRRWA